MPIGRPLRFAAAAALLVLASLACAGDPAQEIERRRAGYSASLAGFMIRDDPGSERPQVLLDVTVRGEAKPPLAGITLDVSMADAGGREKARRRVWVDTSALGPGGEQTTLTLEGLDFAPGDGFWVEVRTPVPPAERGEYRELSAAGGGGR
jgi:hypothetical protein